MALIFLSIFISVMLGSSSSFAAVLEIAPKSLVKDLDLDGAWDFFPEKSALPDSSEIAPCQKIPSYWQGHQCAGKELTAKGTGIYRLYLKGLPFDQVFQFYLIRAFTSYELYVDRKLVASYGGQHELQSQPFQPSQSLTEVLLVIRNPDFMYGGVYNKIRFGPADRVKRQLQMGFYLEVLMASCLGLLGIYHLAFFGLRPSNLSPFLFACFCFLISWRTLFVGQGLYFELMAIARSEYKVLWVMYVSYYIAVPCFALFTHHLFPQEFPRRAWRIALLVSSLFTVPIFITPLSFWQWTAPPFHVFVSFYMLYTSYSVLKAVKNDRDGAKLFFCGVVILSVTTLSDIATLALNVRGPDNAVVFGLFSFLLLQSFILAQRFSHAFAHAEQLSLALKDQERARTQFFHNISHELRTPLNGIIGYLDLTRKGQFGALSQSSIEQLGKALRLAESLTTQVNTILDLAKAKGGELKLVCQQFSLKELKEEADRLAEGLMLRDLSLRYSSDLVGDEDSFQSDREKVFSIIRNLLGNAFKFRDPHRQNVVHLSLQHSAGKLRITVKDTGIGIPPEYQDKIFDEFVQVQGDARRQFEGTGLGLNLVHRLVKLMGGKIELSSELSRGTEFTVEIPETEGGVAAFHTDRTASVAVARGNESIQLLETTQPLELNASNEISILVIDDNEINCEVIKGTLQLDGYQVHAVLSGRVGLEAMQRNPPDLVLLDMMMPEMSGEDVLREMKQQELMAEIPVILVTARASEEDRLEGLRLGADDYLAKPIFAAELDLRVRNMIERHRLVREVARYAQQDKLVQLGELFGDLSHELKNILQGTGFQRLQEDDAVMAAAVMGLGEDLQPSFSASLLRARLNSGLVRRIEDLQSSVPAESHPDLLLIVHHLAALDLDLEKLRTVLELMQAQGAFEQRYFASQLRLFGEFQALVSTTERCRKLTQSVLSYSRMDDAYPEARLDQCWEQAFDLLQPQLRVTRLSCDARLDKVLVRIPAAALTQVFLNLALNAKDAVQNLPEADQWIKLSLEQGKDYVNISVENGGPPIPQAFHEKLFVRGFTSKGDKGSGIGLHVSRRLILAHAGELSYDREASHPRFCLRLLKCV